MTSAPPAPHPAPQPTELGMLDVRGGTSVLRNERKKNNWSALVADFQLARHAVTRELWSAYALPKSSLLGNFRCPVTEVSWIDAISFCNTLSEAAGFRSCYSGLGDPQAYGVECEWGANGYRLPSEAEWEYACRAGSTEPRYGDLDDIAWYRENSESRAHEVATKQANLWGFYDMIGNVWEWCWDVYDAHEYGPYRVFRGGGWCDLPRGCRASCRRRSHPTFRIDDLGFRLARSTSPESDHGS